MLIKRQCSKCLHIIILQSISLYYYLFFKYYSCFLQLEKKRQLETQRVNTFQLMLEKEQSYVDKLRSELAKAGTGSGNVNVATVQTELAGAERRVRTLQEQLAAISTSNEQVCLFLYIISLYVKFHQHLRAPLLDRRINQFNEKNVGSIPTSGIKLLVFCRQRLPLICVNLCCKFAKSA